MTQEDKDLLLKDLCARLPYGVKITVKCWDLDMDSEFTTIETLRGIDDGFIYTITGGKEKHSIVKPLLVLLKPYLRPMSSMAPEEFKEYTDITEHISIGSLNFNICNPETFDYLNKKMFDYRGLIPKGLALEAPEGMYNN